MDSMDSIAGQVNGLYRILAHHWIRNATSYPLVFVVKLYHTQERHGAGVASPPPPPRSVLVWY